MKMILAMIFISVSAAQSSAQITERQQKKDWAYLFKLSKDIKEVENCIYAGSPGENKDKLWQAYHRRVREYVLENDNYIKQYTSTRSKTESEEEFRFRVWSTTLNVGSEEARKAEAALCIALTAFEN